MRRRQCGRRNSEAGSMLRALIASSNCECCVMQQLSNAAQCPITGDPAGRRLQQLVASPLWIRGWVALGVLVRIVLVLTGNGHMRFSDERDYDSIAAALLAGDGFFSRGQTSAFR